MDQIPEKQITDLPLTDKLVHLLRLNNIRTVDQLISANLYQLPDLSTSQRNTIKKVIADYKATTTE